MDGPGTHPSDPSYFNQDPETADVYAVHSQDAEGHPTGEFLAIDAGGEPDQHTDSDTGDDRPDKSETLQPLLAEDGTAFVELLVADVGLAHDPVAQARTHEDEEN